jgi:hypothetical protein
MSNGMHHAMNISHGDFLAGMLSFHSDTTFLTFTNSEDNTTLVVPAHAVESISWNPPKPINIGGGATTFTTTKYPPYTINGVDFTAGQNTSLYRKAAEGLKSDPANLPGDDFYDKDI